MRGYAVVVPRSTKQHIQKLKLHPYTISLLSKEIIINIRRVIDVLLRFKYTAGVEFKSIARNIFFGTTRHQKAPIHLNRCFFCIAREGEAGFQHWPVIQSNKRGGLHGLGFDGAGDRIAGSLPDLYPISKRLCNPQLQSGTDVYR